MENPKLFAALLTGVLQRIFENNRDITPEYLQEHVFQDSASIEDITKMMQLVSRVMSQAAHKNWELAKLEVLLQQSPFSEMQQELFIRFWKIQRPKVNEQMLNKVKWNDSLLQFQWRIDVATKTKDIPELHEASAIVELSVGKQGTQADAKENSLVRFELDQGQLKDVLASIEDIEKSLQSFTS